MKQESKMNYQNLWISERVNRNLRLQSGNKKILPKIISESDKLENKAEYGKE